MAEEARRWTLTASWVGIRPQRMLKIEPEIGTDGDEIVAVREDRVCEADVERVAKALWETASFAAKFPYESLDEDGKTEARRRARIVLAAVFSDSGVEKPEVPDA